MKICKNCNSKIEDDALVCPYCGCVTRKARKSNTAGNVQPTTRGNIATPNTTATPNKKRKTWLWVLGWICIFPLPLTILMLRNQKLNKVAKIAIIAVAWIVYLLIALAGGSGNSTTTDSGTRTSTEQTTTESSTNITGLSFTRTDDITVKVGQSTSSGYLKVDVKSRKNFSPDDVVFISENPEIATIALTRDSSTMLYFELTGVSGGETNVYAMSQDESVKSETIHVIVPEPIGVDSIELDGYNTELCVSQTTSAKASISPSNAEDKTLTWTSSDETVATVDEKGNVTAVGGGSATITVTANNGTSASFDVNVDGTKTLMKLNVRHPREDDINIGDEWSYDVQVNGERAHNEMGIAVGETLTFYAQFTESDDKPDVGSASTTHTVTEDDIANGFEVKMDLYVTENGGRYSGQSAHFIVTYTYSPNK